MPRRVKSSSQWVAYTADAVSRREIPSLMSLQLSPPANAPDPAASNAPVVPVAPAQAQILIPPPILAQRRASSAERRGAAAAVREGAQRAGGSPELARRDAEIRRQNWADAAGNRRQEEAPERYAEEEEEEEEESPAFHPDWPHDPADFPGELTLQARRAINALRAALPEDRPAAREAAYHAMDVVFLNYPEMEPDGWTFGSEYVYPWHVSYESESGTAWPLPNPLFLAEGLLNEELLRTVSVRRRHDPEEDSSAESDANEL